MILAFASRTGNVESIVDQMGYESVHIQMGTEEVDGLYVLFTYTDGWGDVPDEVTTFLEVNNPTNMLGVVVSGDLSYGDAYCVAGDTIAQEHGTEVLYKVENAGTDEDIAKIKEIIDNLA